MNALDTTRINTQAETDRRDLAIGRIIRYLPLLSVRELDAMAERLGRGIHGTLTSELSSTPTRPLPVTPPTTTASLQSA